MSDVALVIGIDHYADPAWRLRAAVRDALRFAEWVTEPGAGRASPETLTLLLSPHPERPVDGVAFAPATREAIAQALHRHKKLGAEARRLWFFYAGHGVAPPAGGPDEAPIVIPEDVTDLDYYLDTGGKIELGAWIREMQVRAPQEQVYFVDACRGLVSNEDVVTATRTLFFDLSKLPASGPASQVVLCGTTAGQLANEQGLHGLFSGVLMDGLRGAGPKLKEDAARLDFVLTFGGLVDYVTMRLQGKADEARRRNRTLPTQNPASSQSHADGSFELVRFAEKPRSRVRLFVEPETATRAGAAAIRALNSWTGGWERQLQKSSPLDVPVEWDLPAIGCRIEVEAQGFRNWWKYIEVTGPTELHAELRPAKSEPPDVEDAGLESLDYLTTRAPQDGAPEPNGGRRRKPRPPAAPKPPDGSDLAPGLFGRLAVDGVDRYARIVVTDMGGAGVASGWGSLDTSLPVGSYRVEITLPTEPPILRPVLITAGKPVVINARPASVILGLDQSVAHILQPNRGFAEPSEMFGLTTATHLGSLLAWAASAAQFRHRNYGYKLRQIGVAPVSPAYSAYAPECFARVVVGDALGRSLKPGMDLLGTVRLILDDIMHVADPVPAIPDLALQFSAPTADPSTDLLVEAEGLAPRRFPLPFVAGHVWTIIVAREPAGRIEIHRYLDPLDPGRDFDDMIRRVEMSWRALEARTPLVDGEAEDMLARALDPLALAVLGYRLARESRWAELHAVVGRLDGAALADVHVLAAHLGDYDANMARAAESPAPPIVGEGYRAMEAWLFEQAARRDLPPPAQPEALSGGVWTAFDAGRRAPASRAFLASDPPAWAQPLLAASRSVARIEAAPRHPVPYVGTGFLVGPRALASADFAAGAGDRVWFDDSETVIERLLATTGDERRCALARIASVAREPLRIRWTRPEVGTRVAVVGFSGRATSPAASTPAFEPSREGEKFISPGVIVEVEEASLAYDCWTMAGFAGAPILDIETGEAIGVHLGGRLVEGGRKLGFGVLMAALEGWLRQRLEAAQ